MKLSAVLRLQLWRLKWQLKKLDNALQSDSVAERAALLPGIYGDQATLEQVGDDGLSEDERRDGAVERVKEAQEQHEQDEKLNLLRRQVGVPELTELSRPVCVPLSRAASAKLSASNRPLSRASSYASSSSLAGGGGGKGRAGDRGDSTLQS